MSKQPNIQLINNFISNPDDILQIFQDTIVWDETFKVRKTASFGVAYQYSNKTYPKLKMPDWLHNTALKIENTFGFLPNNCLLNHYADGKSKMGFHSDDTSQMVTGTGVVIISLGSERIITYRNKYDKSIEAEFLLSNGSALYMDDAVQDDWRHAILPDDTIEPRVSLTFRQLVASEL